MVLITPGVDTLLKASVALGAYAGCASTAATIIGDRLGYEIPTWMTVSGCIVSIPVILTIKVLSTKLAIRRRAWAAGVRLVPEAQGTLPGNLDVVQMMIRSLQTGYPGDGFDKVLEKLGPVVNLRTTWTDIYFTTSPEHIKIILAADFPNYVKGKRFHYNMESVLGTGVFNSDGEMWKFHRSITRPMFTRERISHFELFDRRASQVIGKLRERLREGYAVDFQDLMSRFTLDAATDFLFGTCVESLSAVIPYPHHAPYITVQRTAQGDAANAFAEAFLQAQEVISERERYGWVWPLTEILRDRTKEPMKIVNSYIEPIVQAALRKKAQMAGDEKAEKDAEDDDETLLAQLVKVTDDPVVLKDEILNIMLAGRDTTAATLTFVIYFLASYPEVCARLREEILAKVGSTRRPDYDDIRDMKYLRAVINETLRLYPIVPFNIRESVNDTTWPSEDPAQRPYFIPAGTRTLYSVFMMHRRKDLWGPDAEEFDPDRFLDDRLKTYVSKNPFIFLPFNAGPRICLGQQFAYNEMSFMIVRLLQAFSTIDLDLHAAPDSAPPAEWKNFPGRKGIEKVFPKIHLTMYAKGGLWVKMTESESTEVTAQ